MKHYSDVIARLGREAWLFALRGRYFISRESRSGNLSRRTEQTITLPVELTQAEALPIDMPKAWSITAIRRFLRAVCGFSWLKSYRESCRNTGCKTFLPICNLWSL